MGGKSSSPPAQTTNTQMLDPVIQGAVKDNLALVDQLSQRPYTPYTGDRIAGFSPFENMAFQNALATQGIGMPFLQGAGAQFGRLMNQYTPQIQAQGYDPAMAQAATGDAAQINRGDIQNVNAGGIPTTNMAGYMNPYQDQVVDRTLNSLQRNRAIERTYDKSKAMQAGAFGGTRQAVFDAQREEAYDRNVADTLANLYSGGYDRATALAQQDLGRGLQAQGMNQGVDQAIAQANAGFGQQMNLQNLGALNQFALGNQGAMNQASQFNVGAQNTFAGLNQASMASDLERQMKAAGMFGGLGSAMQQYSNADINTLLGLGQNQRDMAQQNLDLNYQNFMEQLNYPERILALRQAAVGASPMGGSSVSTMPTQQPNRLGGALGGAAMGAGLASSFAALNPYTAPLAIAGGLLGGGFF